MARLNVRPTSPSTGEDASSPRSAHSSTDAEAASQQLLDELTTSVSKPRLAPSTAAERGATLLNAARIDFRHSSPIRPAPKTGKGKLNRVSILAEQLGQRRARGVDVWELPISPEKRASTQPQTRQQNLRPGAKSKDMLTDIAEDQQDIEEEPIHDDAQNTSANDSDEGPDGPPQEEPDAQDVQIEEELPDGTARCALVCYKNDSKLGPTFQQCHNAAKSEIEEGLRCARHANRLASAARCGASIHAGDIPTQCRAAAQSDTDHGPRCKRHRSYEESYVSPSRQHRNHGLTKTKAKRKSTEDVDSARPQVSAKVSRTAIAVGGSPRELPPTSSGETANRAQAQNISRRRDRKNTASHSPELQSSRMNQIEEPVGTVEVDMGESSSAKRKLEETTQAINIPTSTKRRTHRQQMNSSTRTSHQPPSTRERRGRSADTRSGKIEQRDAIEEADEESATLLKVFDFLGLEERVGHCQTKLGTSIKQVCNDSLAIFEEQDATFQEIARTTLGVQEVLQEVSEVPESEYRALKGDAYGYLFRSLVVYLQSLHGWLSKDLGIVTYSLKAMCIFSPLIQDILTFKDILASWNAPLAQRYKGDRMIMDIDSHLITPLRYVNDVYKKRLRLLENKERNRKMLEDIYREIEKEEKEAERRESALTARRRRWQRWQELHIARMEAEPDPYRRRKLVICKLEELDETDANGRKFERVPVFTNRTAPPLHRIPLTSTKEWSEEEETALLEGLQTYVGKNVFQNIFAAYCRPGGVLRDFTVADITTKAAWVSSSWTKLQQEKGWEVPAWVKRIPLLP